MRSSFPLALVAPILGLLLLASACTPTVTPVSPTDTATPRATETPASTASVVAFPTAVTASPTPPPPSPTLPPSTVTGASAAPPVVQFVSPLPNAQVSISQTVYIVGLATTDNAIARLELSDDGNLVRAENAPAPLQTFSAIIPWTPTQIGAHILRLVAFDNNNIASAPEEITVSVTTDTRRPTALIVYPIGSPQVDLGSVLQVYAIATDEAGVTALDLVVDSQVYTYVTAPNAGGQATLSTVFAWNALAAGAHTLLVRAHDNQDQTTDSAPVKITVADTHQPAVWMTVDRTSIGISDTLTVTVNALDVSGVQRVELLTGRDISNTITSSSPSRQTSLSAQVPWQNSALGDYTLTARAYNANGNTKDSAPLVVSVLRPGQATPTRAPSPTPTRTRAPRPLATPRLQPPAPPKAQVNAPSDHFSGSSPLRVTFSGQGSAELDRVELWGYYQDQLQAQLVCTIDARATTQKAGQCDWLLPTAGYVYLYAQAIDMYDQIGRSATVSGVIVSPSLPTPTPTPVSLAGRWTAPASGGQYVIVFRPVSTTSGIALRGDFTLVSAATPPVPTAGRITSGSIKGDRVTFRVEFGAAPAPTGTPSPATTPPETVTTTATPSPSPSATPSATSTSAAATSATPSLPALDFDCGVDVTGTTLDCKFRDARGQSGTALFKREP